MPSVQRPATPYMDAVETLLLRISAMIPANFKRQVSATFVGGAAVHIYTGWRVSRDVDLYFSDRLLLSEQLLAVYEHEGSERGVIFDQNYSSVISLLHPDCWQDAWSGWNVGRIAINVISPVDLAVSKIGRWAGNDENDVKQLALSGLIQGEAVETRCLEALDYFIGNTDLIRYNLRDALDLIRDASS